MAVLVFSLRGVPEDEAHDVRSLLEGHRVRFHETGAGLFGISVPGLWVADPGEAARARALIDDYQRLRQAEQRSLHERRRREGGGRTWVHVLRERPGAVLLYLAAALAILYFSTMPFWQLRP